jgi:hypothetical protein
MTTVYEIRVKGHLVIHNEPNGETTLTGPVRDQAELHGLLTKVRDLNLTLLGVKPVEHTEGVR